MLTEYFDCLRCSAITRVNTCPPKCAVCGSGTGVLAKSPEGAVRKREPRTIPPTGRNEARNLFDALKLHEARLSAPGTPSLLNGEKRA